MALGDALQKRLEELQKKSLLIKQQMRNIAYEATLRAVEEAAEQTPPNCDEKIRGTGMITGRMAQCWREHSQIEPTVIGDEYLTILENRVKDPVNGVQYASFVNDGHRMDKHFVPGLIIDPRTGLLERVDPEIQGARLMVGVKTSYVPGLYMKEKGVDKYKEVVRAELSRKASEVLK